MNEFTEMARRAIGGIVAAWIWVGGFGVAPAQAEGGESSPHPTPRERSTAAAPKPPVTGPRAVRFLSASGEVKWFSEDELRRSLGPERYRDFQSSELSLNAWISEQNEESLGLTIAEVSTLTLGAIGVLVGGLLMLEGASSQDALGQGIGFGLGLPIFGVGAVFGGLGAYLVWQDEQDHGAVHHPALTDASQPAPRVAGMGVTFSASW